MERIEYRRATTALTIMILFIFSLSINNTQSNERQRRGFFTLFNDVSGKPEKEIIGQTYRYSDDSDCEGYFTLIQFWEPNLFVFSYIIPPYVQYDSRGTRGSLSFEYDVNEERRLCDGMVKNGALIMMEVPEDMFETARRDSSLINQIKIHNLNWCKEFGPIWGIDEETQVELSKYYVLKGISESKKTDGTIVMVPVVEHYKFSDSPIEWLKNLGIRWSKWKKQN